ARPARLVRRVRLDWSEWCEAVIRMGEQFLSDLEEPYVPTPSRRAVRERLRALRHPSRLAPPPGPAARRGPPPGAPPPLAPGPAATGGTARAPARSGRPRAGPAADR